MKKTPALISIGIITAATIALTFSQPTIIHQLVIWVSGMFAVLVALAVFAVSNWPQQSDNRIVPNNFVEGKKGWAIADDALILTVKALRNQHFSDWAISRALNTDIDVIKAIP